MSVGRDLLDTPFPQMVQSLAMAIAQGQLALDKTSIETARALAREEVALIEEIQEIIEPRPTSVTLENGQLVPFTGATVNFKSTPPKNYTLLQAGLFPTFYQFTATRITVKMSISTKTTSGSEFEVGATLGVNYGPVSFAAHVNYKSSNSYSYSAEGSSELTTTLAPVPPPARLSPRVITINALVQPPLVTTG